MGRRDPKHTPEMRKAIVQAVEQGFTAREVVELAAAGQLGGQPPFEVAESTVHHLVGAARRERASRAATPNPETETMRRIAQATIARVDALEVPTAKDLSALAQAHRVLLQADRAIAKPPTAPTAGGPAAMSNEEYARRFVACLAARDKAIDPEPCRCDEPLPSWMPEDGPVCQRCHRRIPHGRVEPHQDDLWLLGLAGRQLPQPA
jgi:hypothetical protein